MKQTPRDKAILERMAPGALCADGFLGDDPRDLSEIIAADAAAVEAAELTHEQTARPLAAALKTAMAELGRHVAISEHVAAVWREGMGRIPSPWPGDGVFPKGELELTDTRTGRTLTLTPLSVHLIAAHGFYQGRGSRYRLEPHDIIAMFELT